MKPSEPSAVLQAAAWMSGAIVAFTSMAIAGRAVAVEHDTFETMLFRSIVGFVVVLIVAKAAGTLGQINTRRMGLHVMRNVSHFTGQNLWFYAITVIPLAQVFALEFTSPLWVMALAAIFLGERLTQPRVVAAVLGFIGVLIVARPDTTTLDPNVLIAAAAAIGFAGSAIFTKLLTRTESVTCILFWLTAMQAIFGLTMAGYDGYIALPTAQSAPWLTLIAFAGLTAHFCLTKALILAPASIVMPIDFLRLPIIAVIGMLFYNEGLDLLVLLGGALILAGNLYMVRSESRRG
ncbi:MAG: drug/metabolite transporter (DMT)-like permease [Sulfitobacter sp.]|jgi:drug/metabolite transporter (DMT)-like permease